MIGIISIVLVLGGLIFFHELGHFLVARALGIGVKTFSIGFGPALFSWRGKKTKYQLSVVPLGGYVSMVAENDEADIPAPFTKKESFSLRPPLHRLLIVAAGPVFNLLLAWLLFLGLFWSGHTAPLAEIGSVLPDSPAASAGLRPGDIVKSVDGNETATWTRMYSRIQASEGQPVHLEVERNGQILPFTLTAESQLVKTDNGDEVEVWRIGIAASGRTPEFDFIGATKAGLDETWHTASLIGQFVKRMFTGAGSLNEVGGPVLVGQMVYKQASQGLAGVLYLTAFLSINLGLLNLLPIPALDGGHVLFCTLEIIIRRPIPMKIQAVAIYIGFGLLIMLMLMSTVFDIFRIFK